MSIHTLVITMLGSETCDASKFRQISVSNSQQIEIAKEQLEVALDLFLSGRSIVSSLTLAGAAEEIFGKSLSEKGYENTLQHEYKIISPVEKFLSSVPFEWKDFVSRKNGARNASKHICPSDSLDVCFDFDKEALLLIVRAYDNYIRLGFERTALMCQFDEWFLENIIGGY